MTNALVVGDEIVSLDPEDEGAIGVVTDIKVGQHSGIRWIHVRWSNGAENICRDYHIARRISALRGAA